jgi:hypothetical protein
LHSSLEKKPIPSRPHTPIAKLVDIIKRFISADNSARAPTLATPISNEAPGIGTLIPTEKKMRQNKWLKENNIIYIS